MYADLIVDFLITKKLWNEKKPSFTGTIIQVQSKICFKGNKKMNFLIEFPH